MCVLFRQTVGSPVFVAFLGLLAHNDCSPGRGISVALRCLDVSVVRDLSSQLLGHDLVRTITAAADDSSKAIAAMSPGRKQGGFFSEQLIPHL